MMRTYLKVVLAFISIIFFSLCWAKVEQGRANIVLNISGLSGEVLENVKSRLDIKKQNIFASQADIVKWNYYRTIDKEVEAAIQPFGYFEAEINTDLTRQNDQWTISIVVKPNRRMQFQRVDIQVFGEGQSDPAFQKYLAKIPIHPGDYFNSGHYTNVKDTLQNMASNRGYFRAKFIKSKLVVNLRSYTASVLIDFDTGARARIGATTFSPSPFKQELLQRYLAYEPNELYNNYLLDQSRQNLSNSGFFQSVVVMPEINRINQKEVPITITMHPQDQVIYTFGAGYGTDSGPRGLAATNIRWLNSSGHSMKMQVRGSQYNSEAGLNYTIPGKNPAIDSYTFNTGVMYLNQVTGTGKNAQAGFSYQTKVADWQLVASLTNLIERYSLINFPTTGVTTTTNANVLYPQLLLQRIYAKPDLINPDYGYNILMTAAGGSNSLGSKTNFLQSQLTNKFLVTLDATHTRFLVRAAVGAISIQNLENLPLSMQFYAGGSQSIRGFEYNGIGPGRQVLIGSVEVQQRIFGKFYAAAFIDAGNVSDHVLRHRANVGAGPAVMYLSPIGAIELSVAKNISSINQVTGQPNGGWRIHFSLGALI